MRIPSRRMPPAPAPHVISPSATVGCLALGLATFALISYHQPWVLAASAVLGLIIGGCILAVDDDQERINRLAAERRGESICSFARALDFRRLDTWIIRAVYEEVRQSGPDLPIRPSDRLEGDLRIDPEDWDDLVAAAAHRSRRAFPPTADNPWVGKVETVHDLIRLLSHQPRLADRMGSA